MIYLIIRFIYRGLKKYGICLSAWTFSKPPQSTHRLTVFMSIQLISWHDLFKWICNWYLFLQVWIQKSLWIKSCMLIGKWTCLVTFQPVSEYLLQIWWVAVCFQTSRQYWFAPAFGLIIMECVAFSVTEEHYDKMAVTVVIFIQGFPWILSLKNSHLFLILIVIVLMILTLHIAAFWKYLSLCNLQGISSHAIYSGHGSSFSSFRYMPDCVCYF